MNFHKTIGFLATLLLTLGLGVPNSFAQTVDLSFNPPSMDEGGGLAVGKLVVSVTLDADAADATTVTVTLAAADAGNTINLATAGRWRRIGISLGSCRSGVLQKMIEVKQKKFPLHTIRHRTVLD